MMRSSNQSGVTIVEIIFGVAIAGLAIVFITHTLTLFFNTSTQTLNRTQALYLVEEGQELLTHLRDTNWDTFGTTLANNTPHYLAVSTTTVAVTATPEVIDNTFTRSFVLSEVRRDSSTHDLVATGGVVDPGGRYVTVSVTWDGNTVSSTGLLTNIHDI